LKSNTRIETDDKQTYMPLVMALSRCAYWCALHAWKSAQHVHSNRAQFRHLDFV